MNKPPTLTILGEYQFGARLGYSEASPSKEILAAIGSDWILHRVETQGLEVFKLTNVKSKTSCQFVADGDTVHILMFNVTGANEGNFFTARREFAFLVRMFWDLGFAAVQGHALTNTKGQPLARSREWRDRRVGRDTKLQRFWLRLGAADIEGALTFLAPRFTITAKALAASYGLENPYKYLSSHSVYGSELSTKLLAA